MYALNYYRTSFALAIHQATSNPLVRASLVLALPMAAVLFGVEKCDDIDFRNP